jgi:2,4-dienoyl-CoA reductase-like NADH-dependent reductase (Old Yellow Enzyme family)
MMARPIPWSAARLMPRLFQPLRLGELTLRNRIVIAPMCQYSAEDGSATDWHLAHLGSLALSGAGLLILEATAVSAEGRITPGDLGLYSDANEAALRRVIEVVRNVSPIPLGLQIAHAGRKASSREPWNGGAQIPAEAPRGWLSVAPSALPHGDGEEAPAALDRAGLDKVREDFVATARRAVRLGFDAIEIHGAHGYLLHEFLSPIANARDDEYGGSLENRMRFPLEVFEAVRAAVPSRTPLWMRLSATDWVEGGWDVESTIVLAKALEQRGAAATHVSSAGVSPKQAIPLGPGYQVPFARAVKQATHAPVIAVGLITEPEQAEAILQAGDADAIGIGRAALYDPRWPWHAAARLGAQIAAPHQYWRSHPREVKDLFVGAKVGMR